ncbi:hypothetical protein ACF0H5_012349 [Mactra antiquata]
MVYNSFVWLFVTVWFALCFHEIYPKTFGNKPNPAADAEQNSQVQALKSMCKRLCQNGGVCPPECAEVYLDPWSASLPDESQLSIKKRLYNSGIDGLTFEDYLFMRWLGRDMIRRRLE